MLYVVFARNMGAEGNLPRSGSQGDALPRRGGGGQTRICQESGARVMPCLVGAGAGWSGVGTLASPLLEDYPLPPLLDRILNVLLASRRCQGNVLSSSKYKRKFVMDYPSSKGCILK